MSRRTAATAIRARMDRVVAQQERGVRPLARATFALRRCCGSFAAEPHLASCGTTCEECGVGAPVAGGRCAGCAQGVAS